MIVHAIQDVPAALSPPEEMAIALRDVLHGRRPVAAPSTIQLSGATPAMRAGKHAMLPPQSPVHPPLEPAPVPTLDRRPRQHPLSCPYDLLVVSVPFLPAARYVVEIILNPAAPLVRELVAALQALLAPLPNAVRLGKS